MDTDFERLRKVLLIQGRPNRIPLVELRTLDIDEG